MDRTFVPMGAASMRHTRRMPSASTAFTWSGSVPPDTAAVSAGTRLSRMTVVLPEPDTPVTAVSRPFGTASSSAWTVWSGPVRSRIVPYSKSASSGTGSRTHTASRPDRKGPMRDCGAVSAPAAGPV